MHGRDSFQLSEYSYLTGCGHCVGTAGSIEELPWEECNGLDTYSVQRGSTVLAEFEGDDACVASAWLKPPFAGLGFVLGCGPTRSPSAA